MDIKDKIIIALALYVLAILITDILFQRRHVEAVMKEIPTITKEEAKDLDWGTLNWLLFGSWGAVETIVFVSIFFSWCLK